MASHWTNNYCLFFFVTGWYRDQWRASWASDETWWGWWSFLCWRNWKRYIRQSKHVSSALCWDSQRCQKRSRSLMWGKLWPALELSFYTQNSQHWAGCGVWFHPTDSIDSALLLESFRTSTSRTFNSKVFARISPKTRHPGKLHFIFFTKKVSTVIYTEGG